MSKPSDLPLYLATYKLIKYLYVLVTQFPKGYKFSLGESILILAWNILDLVIEANAAPNNYKAELIQKASISFDKLKIRLRLAHELKLINDKRYAYVLSENEGIGKMLSGWQKWAEKA